MKLAKILGCVVLAIFGLAVLLYLVALAANWNDRPPSAAAQKLDQIIAARPPVATADNAAAYLLGFNAPADQDPLEVGARRLAWLESYTAQAPPGSDPLSNPLELKSQGTPALKALGPDCGRDGHTKCMQVFEELAAGWQPTEMETLALQRYRTLLGLRGWRDAVPFSVTAPLAPYADVTHAQRLYLLSLAQLAREGKADAVREGLSEDLRFWRDVQRSSEILIAKMISLGAIRKHFFYSSLILRGLPPEQVMRAVPAEWQREFSDEERSMLLVMAGEWKFSQGMLRDALNADTLGDDLAAVYEPAIMGTWLNSLAKPLFKEQDTANVMAGRYLRFAEQFAVSMNEYAHAKDAVETEDREQLQPLSIYNPVGDVFLREIGGSTFVNYAYGCANSEGIRRAALLVAQLRGRGIDAAGVADELARAELRDPYSGSPFEWDANNKSVLFISPDKGSWQRHEFFY